MNIESNVFRSMLLRQKQNLLLHLFVNDRVSERRLIMSLLSIAVDLTFVINVKIAYMGHTSKSTFVLLTL